MNHITLIKQEIQAFFSNQVVVLTILGVIFYSFLYPLPYAQQIPRNQVVSVVNLDKSQASYQLERLVDATPQVTIGQRDHTIKAAQSAFLRGDVSGILVIPEHFYKDLLLGKSPVLSYAGDASYFLTYGTIVEGLAHVGATVGAKAKIARLVIEGEPINAAATQSSPVKLNMKPTFNSGLGYLNYVVPAVFILILQQTMVMAAGLIGGTQKQGQGYWNQYSRRAVFMVRTIMLVVIYYLLSLYYFGASFTMYGISRLASIASILAILLPFLLSSCFIGIWLGAIMPRRELVTFVVLVSSMPLIFSAGFIWPAEMIPNPILYLAALFPSTAAVKAFLTVNQFGAPWHQIAAQWSQLWLQTACWGGIAYFSFKRQQQRD